MPKARVENELSNDGKFALVQMNVTERKDDNGNPIVKTTQYRKPLTFGALADWVMNASGKPGLDFRTLFPITDRKPDETDSEQALLLRLVTSALAAWARADVYTSLSAESTIVSIGGTKYDLMDYKVGNFVKGYNGTAAHRASQLSLLGVEDESDPQFDNVLAGINRKMNWNQYSTAASKHVESGVARFDGDTLVAV